MVVALAGAAVDDRLRAEVERDVGHGLRDHGPRQRGDERVAALVEGVRHQRLRDLVAGERLRSVEDDHVVGAGEAAALERLLVVGLLADVHEHRHDLVEAVVLLEPRDRAARVEPARVGEHRRTAHVAPSR